MDCFKKLNSELQKIADLGTERSYYPILKEFLITFAKEELKLSSEINVISEATSKVHESRVGFPDLTVQIKSYDFQTLGWIEVKLPKDNLNDDKFNEQFSRYTDSLENILFTNLREWTLYQWDDKGKPKKIEEVLFDASNGNEESKALINLLDRFFNGKTLEIKTPKQLALALARKTRLLSRQVQESLEEGITNDEKENNLIKLKNAFSETLIKDIEPHQFANMAAETIAYSFFLAALEHQKRGNDEPLTLTTAIDYLPNSVPILHDLYDLIGKSAKNNESIRLSVESLIEQFHKADMEKIYKSLSKHQIGQDPIIHFYEPFLAEYDPREREARGVYYTPKPVVDYIVKSVDWILKEKFGKVAGIEDRNVYLLDPATGTGTFLMSAIEMIEESKRRQFGSLGEEIVKKEFCRVVQNHILKHFFGFELMIAPYAIAHLKLTMLLEEFGFNFDMSKDNDDKEDDRLKIFLANTLDEPHEKMDKGQIPLFSFHEAISEESRLASEVKTHKPIMAIIGNPPYSGHSSNNSDWIRKLVKDYYFVDGKPLGERNPKWLQDDYVKFIRFAQWKIKQTGEGVAGYITNHAYLDNPTFRGMRQQLMENFNEIYILDLHGNGLKKEKTPEGNKDENVFNIQAGVAIVFLIKYKDKSGCKIYRTDIYGNKAEKLDWLAENKLEPKDYREISPKHPSYMYKNQDSKIEEEYQMFYSIRDIFKISNTGIITKKDHFAVDFEKEPLLERIQEFANLNKNDEYISNKYDLKLADKDKWNLHDAREKIQEIKDLRKEIIKITYRPFDNRSIFYDKIIIARTVSEVMRHMLFNNYAISLTRRWGAVGSNDFDCCLVTDTIVDLNLFRRGGENIFPIYLYENEVKTTNFIKTFRCNFDIFNTTDEGVFNYIYGILFLKSYKTKYKEQLKIEFPRIPIPSQVIGSKLLNENTQDPKVAFKQISAVGNKLQNLHLLTDPIFEDQSKWNVKIGGSKPDGLDDWKVTKVEYKEGEKRVYVNSGQYFEGIESEVWNYYIGGYQVLDKWLKDRKKAERCLSLDDLMHYMKIVVSIRETVQLLKEV